MGHGPYCLGDNSLTRQEVRENPQHQRGGLEPFSFLLSVIVRVADFLLNSSLVKLLSL